jgi:hypothetical protein
VGVQRRHSLCWRDFQHQQSWVLLFFASNVLCSLFAHRHRRYRVLTRSAIVPPPTFRSITCLSTPSNTQHNLSAVRIKEQRLSRSFSFPITSSLTGVAVLLSPTDLKVLRSVNGGVGLGFSMFSNVQPRATVDPAYPFNDNNPAGLTAGDSATLNGDSTLQTSAHSLPLLNLNLL